MSTQYRFGIIIAFVIPFVVALLWLTTVPSNKYGIEPNTDPAATNRSPEQATTDSVKPVATVPFRFAETTEPRPSPTTASRTGQLLLLRFKDRTPVAERLWTLTPVADVQSSQSPVSLPSDSAGIIHLPPGRWTVADPQGVLVPLQSLAIVRSESTTVLFVQATGVIRFIVADQLGRPLPAARGVWIPRIVKPTFEPEASLMHDPLTTPAGVEAVANAAGDMVFESCAMEAGIACFFADGFGSETRFIEGMVGEPVRVTMWPTGGEPRRLKFCSIIDGTPFNSVSVWSHRGARIASAIPQSNDVVIPAYVKAADELIARAEGAFPTIFKLEAIESDQVQIYPICKSSVYVEDNIEPAAPATIFIEPLGQGRPHEIRIIPLIAKEDRLEVQKNSPALVTLPQGFGMRLRALDRLGRSGCATVNLSDSVSEIKISLDEKVRLEVHVTGDMGTPLAKAYATVYLREGREVRSEADENGLIRIPAGYLATWMWIYAPGYARASLYRESNIDLSRYESIQLFVTLKKANDVPILVRDPANAAIPGIRVFVSRHNIPDPEAQPTVRASVTGIWRVADPRIIIGTTDQEGQFWAHDVVPGLVDVRVRIPDAMLGGLVTGAEGDFYAPYLSEVDILDSSEVVMRCSPPRLVTVLVFEEATGRPVSSFTVALGPRTRADVVGNMWQGWVDPDSPPLVITAPDLGKAGLEISRCCEGEIVHIKLPLLNDQ